MSPSSKPRTLTPQELETERLTRERTRDPLADAIRAWTNPAGSQPLLHATRQAIIRRELPLLADALDRLAKK